MVARAHTNGVPSNGARPNPAGRRDRPGFEQAIEGARELTGQARLLARQRTARAGLMLKRWFAGVLLGAVAALLLLVFLCALVVMTLWALVGGVAAMTSWPTWAAALLVAAGFAAAGALAWTLWQRRIRRRIEALDRAADVVHEMKRSGRKLLRGMASRGGLLVAGGIGVGATLALRRRGVGRVVATGLRAARASAIGGAVRKVAREVRRGRSSEAG